MTPLSRTASLLAARTGLALVLFSLAGFGVWTVGDLLGQPPAQKKRGEEEEEAPKAQTPPAKKKVRVEEEEEPAPKKPKRKVIQVEEEESSKSKGQPKRPAAVPSASGDLKQLAEQTKHPVLRPLFGSLAVPHDRVLHKRLSGVTHSGENRQQEFIIKPTSLYLGDDPGRYRHEKLKFTELSTDTWEEIRSYSPSLESLEAVRPYEKIAQDKVRAFLRETYDRLEPDDRFYLSRHDMLDAAEKVLKSVLSWHKSAREKGQRKGVEWEDVEKELLKQLLDDVQLQQMKLYAGAKDWDRVLELTYRLARTYTDAAERQRIFRPVADMLQSALRGPIPSEKTRLDACKRLVELDREFPNNPALRPIRDQLRAEAQSLLDTAKEALKEKNPQKAQEYQLKAQEIWPQLEDLQSFRSELRREHPILRVGVRGPLPRYFSPAWAYTDNERRAVEMLFESLVKLVPDGVGGYRHVRGLSESYPEVLPLSRRFKLPREALWTDRRPLNSTDIDQSMKQFQSGMGVGRSRVWGDLLVGMEQTNDPFQVTIRLKQGFLDPLSLMTFKILPRDKDIASEEFAKDPVTSGPFRLDRSRESDDGRECRFFLANQDYSRRAGKHDSPHIQEVRFYRYDGNTVAEDLRGGKLDLVLDLTAKEADELLQKQKADGLPIQVPLPSPNAANRRIYFLAVNTRKLEDATLRKALSYAIDRETLLNRHFRSPLKAPLHKALCGPFPAGSWACKPVDGNANDKSSRPLFDKDAAKTMAQQPPVLNAVKSGSLKLKYPDDDPALDEAMKDLCAQVKELTGVVLEPTPTSPYTLREDVEQTKNYDLAYYHYDFPDECYWLAPLFGPPPGMEDDKNIFKFKMTDLDLSLDGAKSFRNFAMVQQHQWFTQELLSKQMPFIPLWQLDPLLAFRREVKPASLDPLMVFTNIADWYIVHK